MDQNDADQKPELTLVKPPFTAEKLAELFEKIKGRPVTEAEMATFREGCAKRNAAKAGPGIPISTDT
jgi:hypothetical protein